MFFCGKLGTLSQREEQEIRGESISENLDVPESGRGINTDL